ncbi:MAG TPA: apolipoprotein N-acyltransferase [Candidatus Latescibacteria bacterium]|nr:apolipoprotein N-acyltransferase [Candidatus Latescibacterota bacterium]
MVAESGSFASGAGHKVLSLPQGVVKIGVFVCYESIFPSIPRALASLGAALLVNTTNDAWFGRTAAPRQHLSMAVFRAVETGRPIVRAANTGISCAISPAGEISHATQLFETSAFSVNVVPRSTPTFYVRHGDVFLVVCALFLLGTFAAQRRRQRGRACAETT